MSSIRYFLPQTRLVLSGVIEYRTTRFEDPNLDDQLPPVVMASPLSTALAWQTLADQSAPLVVQTDGSFAGDILTKIGFTADRRLSSFGNSSTGKLDLVIKASLKAATTLVAAGVLLTEGADAGQTVEQAAYDIARPAESRHLSALRTQLRSAKAVLSARRQVLLQLSAETPIPQAAFRELTSMQSMIDALESEIDEAQAQMQLWVQSRTSKRTETVQTILTLQQLPVWTGSALVWGNVSPTADGDLSVVDIWERLEFVVARVGELPHPSIATQEGSGIFVRIPRLQTFALVRKGPGDDDPPLVEELFQRWVMDSRCDVEYVGYKKPIFGKRELTMEFDADGALLALTKASNSGAAEAINGVVDGINEGLASAKTVVETIDTFLSHGDAARKAALERELAIAKTELELAGAGATKSEYAKAARLAQLAAMAASRKGFAEAGPGRIADLVAQNPDLLSWYQPPTPSGPPEPQVIRLVVERDQPTQ